MSPDTNGNVSAVQTCALSRHFGGLVAVDGIDLSIAHGELFSLLGPNGAGKTTTIKMLCCLLQPTGGTATILGHDVGNDPLSVKSVIDVRKRSEELLGMMGLTERAHEQVKKYSGGMKRRLSIAMALVSDPQVLFLDEPTLGLDPQSRRAIWEHIAGLKGQKTIVLTTHYLEEADALADRIAIIDEGKIVALGTPGQLKNGISETPVTVVEAKNLTEGAINALRQIYPEVRAIQNGVEIEAAEVSLYAIEDCLRPMGVVIQSTYKRQVTLDDVFVYLTGKQLRE
jgi:ABC-2 type transport system ATP-binding protein